MSATPPIAGAGVPVTAAAPTPTATPQGSAGPTAAAGTAVTIDRVDIEPLDPAAALQLLLAEVRVALALPLDSLAIAGPVPEPLPTSQAVIRLLLQAVPQESVDPAAWVEAAGGSQQRLEAALDRAVDAVSGWRNVEAAAVAAAHETRSLVLDQLVETPLSPLWLRPEWSGLAPFVQRYWRRRHRARRGLTDPDAEAPRPRQDELEEP